MNLIIDVGNSFIKFALFDANKLIDFKSEKINEWETALENFINGRRIKKIIFSTVSIDSDILLAKLLLIAPVLKMSTHLKFPINIKYKSIETLGTDRLCGTIGALVLYGKTNTLVIDCGTCITYNFLEGGNDFIGGSISPGIELRYKALHSFTKNLPYLETKGKKPQLLGSDTNSSIESGVLNGVLFEMEGAIDQYKLKFGLINVILTGGNHTYFANNLKNTTFAHPNLVLIGLNDILEYNT
jgi:type III pantothenate kinase